MKRYTFKHALSLILSILLVLTLFAGCGSDGESETSGENSTFNFSDGLDDNGSFEGVKASDYIKLPEYEGIEISADTYTASEDDIQSQIDTLLQNYAETEQITDRAVADGDSVNIAYTGRVDGVEFDGGSTTGTTVTIGETQYIDDFLEQLIGHTPGETFDVEVTFPDEYSQNPDLEGKDAVFETTINYIEGESIVPEFNDDFVAENLQSTYGWTTAAEAREQIVENIEAAQISNYIWDYLRENSEVSEIPDVMINYETQNMLYQYESYASAYGMELEEYLSSAFQIASVDDLISQYSEQIETNCKDYLIVQAIADEQDIEITEDDVVDYFTEYMGTDDYSQYESNYGMPFIKFQIKITTVNNLLSDKAVKL